MPPLSDRARTALDAYAAAHRPPPASKAQNRAEMLRRIAAHDDPPEAAPTGATISILQRPLWQLGAALAAAVVVAIGVASLGELATQDSDGPAPAMSAAPAEARAPNVAESATEPHPTEPHPTEARRGGGHPVVAPEPTPDTPPSVSPEPPPEPSPRPLGSRGPNRGRPPPSPPKHADAPPPVDTLAAEVELIGQARRAAVSGADDRALALFQRHAREFPRGSLRHEREAWLTMLRCRLGKPDAATDARAYLRAHAKSPQAARVRRACSIPDPNPVTDSGAGRE